MGNEAFLEFLVKLHVCNKNPLCAFGKNLVDLSGQINILKLRGAKKKTQNYVIE